MESNLVQNLINLKSLPETWAVKDFKEVVSDNSGGNKKLAKSNFLNEGEIAVVDQGKELIAGYYNDTSLAVKTQPPYVIFGDHTRAFKYVDFPFIMGADGTKVLQPKKGNCNTKYLYYFFLSISVPNTGYNRHFKYLKNLKIPLPPLDQQKKIAAILDAADAYRQKTKALIEKYEELTQSLFLDMFGDPVSNPKKLPKIKLGKLGKWQSGGTPSRSNSAYYEGEIPWLSSGELNQMYISDSKEHITEQAIKESNTKLIAKGSILLGMYDTAALKSTINTEVVSCNQAIAYCKLDDRLVNTSFVYHIIQIGKEHYRRLQRGVRQKNLNLSMVKGIEILFPPIKLQNQFAERVQAIEAQKAQAQASLAQAEDLFNSLLQRAFKGELV